MDLPKNRQLLPSSCFPPMNYIFLGRMCLVESMLDLRLTAMRRTPKMQVLQKHDTGYGRRKLLHAQVFFRVIEGFLWNTGYFADFVELLCGVIPQNYMKSVISCFITRSLNILQTQKARKISHLRLLSVSGKLRVAGIEPALHAWEARVLPLNDTRMHTQAQCNPAAMSCQAKLNARYLKNTGRRKETSPEP